MTCARGCGQKIENYSEYFQIFFSNGAVDWDMDIQIQSSEKVIGSGE